MASEGAPEPRIDRRSAAIRMGVVVAASVAVVAFVLLSRADDERGLMSRLREQDWEVSAIDISGFDGPYPVGQREVLTVAISGDRSDAQRLCVLLRESNSLGAKRYDSWVVYGGDRSISLDCQTDAQDDD